MWDPRTDRSTDFAIRVAVRWFNNFLGHRPVPWSLLPRLSGDLNVSNRVKESLENINVDGSKMECDCVNSWLQGAEFNNGYNCDDANEVTECAPKVAKDGYNFEFQEDTSQSAIVSEL